MPTFRPSRSNPLNDLPRPFSEEASPGAPSSQTTVSMAGNRSRGTHSAGASLRAAIANGAVNLLGVTQALAENDRQRQFLADRTATIEQSISMDGNGPASPTGVRALDRDVRIYARSMQRIRDGVNRIRGSLVHRLTSNVRDMEELANLQGELESASQAFSNSSFIRIRQEISTIREELSAHLRNTQSASSQGPTSFSLPSKPSVFFGRDEVVDRVVQEVLRSARACFTLLGAGGIGKSTTLVAICHQPGIADFFGPNRFFVRCDAAQGYDGLVREIAEVLRLEGQNLAEQIFHFLSQSWPILLGLDNLETCLADQFAVEGFLARVSTFPNVTLLVTMRGTEVPYGAYWTEPRLSPLEALDEESARKTFLQICGKDDANLKELLRELCYIPLAVTLAAILARGDETPTSLLDRWREESIALLDRGQQHRTMSVEFSIQLSIESHMLKQCPDALRLLSMASILPSGILRGKLRHLVPDDMQFAKAASILFRTALAEKDATSDLRMHALIRAYVQKYHPPDHDLLHTLQQYYLDLADVPDFPPDRSWAVAFNVRGAEISNMQAAFEYRLRGILSPAPQTMDRQTLLRTTVPAIKGLGRLQQWTALGSTSTLQLAVDVACAVRDGLSMARCLHFLARLERWRLIGAKVPVRLEAALALYQENCDMIGMAECLRELAICSRNLGRHGEADSRLSCAFLIGLSHKDGRVMADCLHDSGVALADQERTDEAHNVFLQAYLLRCALQDANGMAYTMHSLAWIQAHWGNYDIAYEMLNNIRPLWEQLDFSDGLTHCLLSMGYLAIRRGMFDDAEPILHQALQTAGRLSDIVHIGRCHYGLGEVHLYHQHYTDAWTSFSEALRLHRRSGWHRGVGACLQKLGEILRAENRPAEATSQFLQALEVHRSGGWRCEIEKCIHSLRSLGSVEPAVGPWQERRTAEGLGASEDSHQSLADSVPFARPTTLRSTWTCYT